MIFIFLFPFRPHLPYFFRKAARETTNQFALNGLTCVILAAFFFGSTTPTPIDTPTAATTKTTAITVSPAMQPAPHPLPLVSSAMAAVNWFSVRVCAASVELEGETTAEVGGASASVPAASEADVVDVVASASFPAASEADVVDVVVSASFPAASEADVVDVVASASLVAAVEVGVVSVSVVVVSGSAIAECELVVFLSQPHLPG